MPGTRQTLNLSSKVRLLLPDLYAPIAQMVEHRTCNAGVVRSIRTGGSDLKLFPLSSEVEQLAVNQPVARSIRAVGACWPEVLGTSRIAIPASRVRFSIGPLREAWSHGPKVRTPDFQSGYTGSIPVGTTND